MTTGARIRRPASGEMAEWIAAQRWFAGKARRIVGVVVEDGVALGPGALWIVRVEQDDGTAARYAVPLRGDAMVADALDDPAFCHAFLALIASGGRQSGERGEVVGMPAPALRGLSGNVPVRRIGGEQSNTSIVFGDALILKHFRRLRAGPNPEIEIARFLTERTGFRHTPRFFGSLEYRDAEGGWALAVVQELVSGAADGWSFVLDRLRAGDAALGALERLGHATAELHLALASDPGDPDFTPEPTTRADTLLWTAGIERQLSAARDALGGAMPDGVPSRLDAGELAGLVGAVKMRHHGDFHLGQTLVDRAGERWTIIDFEGEPLRPLAERRRKHTPLRDVAGLLRSLGYAAATARAPDDWEARARRAFLEAYRAAAGRAPFLPDGEAAFTRAVAVLEVEKAAYEVVYEASNRPDWIAIPLGGLVRAARAVA